jgi:hypothetical protein
MNNPQDIDNIRLSQPENIVGSPFHYKEFFQLLLGNSILLDIKYTHRLPEENSILNCTVLVINWLKDKQSLLDM